MGSSMRNIWRRTKEECPPPVVCHVNDDEIVSDDYVPTIQRDKVEWRYRAEGAVLAYVKISYSFDRSDNLRVRSLRGKFWTPLEVPPQAYFGHPPEPLPYEYPVYRSMSILLREIYTIVFCPTRYDAVEQLSLYRVGNCVSNDYVDLGIVARKGIQAPRRVT